MNESKKEERMKIKEDIIPRKEWKKPHQRRSRIRKNNNEENV